MPITSAFPNIFFQNAKLSALAPRQHEVAEKHTLPDVIHFYLHVSTYRCSFPLPREFPESQYMHTATTLVGHEAAGPATFTKFDPSTVIGLQAHQLVDGHCPFNIVLVVPVTPRLNPYLVPRQLTFQPATASQLHSSRHLPRIIVPVVSHVSSSAMRQANLILDC